MVDKQQFLVHIFSGSIGVSNMKISILNFRIVRISDTNKWDSRRTLMVHNAPKLAGLVLSRRSDKLRTVCCSPSGSKNLGKWQFLIILRLSDDSWKCLFYQQQELDFLSLEM